MLVIVSNWGTELSSPSVLFLRWSQRSVLEPECTIRYLPASLPVQSNGPRNMLDITIMLTHPSVHTVWFHIQQTGGGPNGTRCKPHRIRLKLNRFGRAFAVGVAGTLTPNLLVSSPRNIAANRPIRVLVNLSSALGRAVPLADAYLDRCRTWNTIIALLEDRYSCDFVKNFPPSLRNCTISRRRDGCRSSTKPGTLCNLIW